MRSKFLWLLGCERTAAGRAYTVALLAQAVGTGRSHLTQVLRNTPARGFQTRRKVAAFIVANFPLRKDEMLRELGWGEAGELAGGTLAPQSKIMIKSKIKKQGVVLHGTSHVEHGEQG